MMDFYKNILWLGGAFKVMVMRKQAISNYHQNMDHIDCMIVSNINAFIEKTKPWK